MQLSRCSIGFHRNESKLVMVCVPRRGIFDFTNGDNRAILLTGRSQWKANTGAYTHAFTAGEMFPLFFSSSIFFFFFVKIFKLSIFFQVLINELCRTCGWLSNGRIGSLINGFWFNFIIFNNRFKWIFEILLYSKIHYKYLE